MENTYKIRKVDYGYYNPSYTLQKDGKFVEDEKRNTENDAIFRQPEADMVFALIAEQLHPYTGGAGLFLDVVM